MIRPLAPLLWPPDECHRRLLAALDRAFADLSRRDGFEDDWRNGKTVPRTKTAVRQTPMLGLGAEHREAGGFYLFAEQYVNAEGKPALPWRERCSFERYRDFVLFSAGDWLDGRVVPLLIAECESNPDELLGELSGLVSTRCPLKYLFIDAGDRGELLPRLEKFAADPEACATDWAGTAYYVIEIPHVPSRPSTWKSIRGQVEETGGPIRFARLT